MDGPRLRWSTLVAALSVASACSVAGPPSTDTTPSAALEPELFRAPDHAPDRSPEPAAAPAKAPVLDLTFVGDVVLGRYLADESFAEMHAPANDPFIAVRSLLAAAVVVGKCVCRTSSVA